MSKLFTVGQSDIWPCELWELTPLMEIQDFFPLQEDFVSQTSKQPTAVCEKSVSS